MYIVQCTPSKSRDDNYSQKQKMVNGQIVMGIFVREQKYVRATVSTRDLNHDTRLLMLTADSPWLIKL